MFPRVECDVKDWNAESDIKLNRTEGEAQKDTSSSCFTRKRASTVKVHEKRGYAAGSIWNGEFGINNLIIASFRLQDSSRVSNVTSHPDCHLATRLQDSR